jgi:hypothetical protein
MREPDLCPQCRNPVDHLVAGVNVYPNDPDQRRECFQVCWQCDIARRWWGGAPVGRNQPWRSVSGRKSKVRAAG